MIDYELFKGWLKSNTNYTDNVISDVVSRMKRANSIMEYDNSETYLYYMERQEMFKKLSISVRSQIRKAVRLYEQYKDTSST
jgi:DNA (cytosine-5)-methyltransferase 1